MACETVITETTTSVRVNTTAGAIVNDVSPRVRVVAGEAEAIIRPQEGATIVVRHSVLLQGPAFQNLFIGFPSSFPAVTHPSLLLKSGQYADPTIYEPYVLDED